MTGQRPGDHTRSGQLEVVGDVDRFAIHFEDDGGGRLAIVPIHLEFERRLRMRTRLDVEQSTCHEKKTLSCKTDQCPVCYMGEHGRIEGQPSRGQPVVQLFGG